MFPSPPFRLPLIVRAPLQWLLLALGIFLSVATNLADPPPEGDVTSTTDSADDAPATNCQTDAECTETNRTHCFDSYNICVECLDDTHCTEDARCSENRCVAACESDAACGEDLLCIDGLCRACNTDSDCGAADLYCYEGPESALCRPLCLQSTECAAPGYETGSVCRGGRCQIATCRADIDCLLDRETCDLTLSQCASIF